MKLVLLFPPPGNASQPYTSLPALTAFMRRADHTVVQRDLNIEAVDALLIPARLGRARGRVEAALTGQEAAAVRTEAEEERRSSLVRVGLAADAVIASIEPAKAALRSPEGFYDYPTFARSLNLIQRARDLISAEHYPSFWTETQLGMPGYGWSVADLLAATRDETQNIFLAYFRDIVAPSVVAEHPGIIGISITYSGQIIPGLTLARLLKAACPGAHICIGGAMLASMAAQMRRNPALFEIVDSAVIYEGEHALLALAEAVESGAPLADVPNLLYRLDGEVHATSTYIEDVNALPTPDYAGLPLDRYLAAELTALLPTERGCYWKRCTFCTISTGMQTYRPRRIELVLEDMARISQQLHTRSFFLANDAAPPARMLALARGLSERAAARGGATFLWQTEARLERSLTEATCRTLHAGGCRRLMLGLESGAPRVLTLMDKGVTTDQASSAIANCHQAGISTHVFFIAGFPGEMLGEARATLDFIEAHAQAIDSLNLAQFDLNVGSRVHQDPEAYGLADLTEAPADWLNGNIYRYRVSEGLQPDEVTAELFPEAARRLRRCFPHLHISPRVLTCGQHPFLQNASWALLNYLAWYGARRWPELPLPPAGSPAEALLRDEGLALFDLAPGLAPGLTWRIVDPQHIAIFQPASGEIVTVQVAAHTLLTLCNGRDPLRELAGRFAAGCELAERPRAYLRGLQLCAQLVARGVLTLAEPIAVAGGVS